MRYAAAVRYLGLRQAWINLVHRIKHHGRYLGRLPAASGQLRFRGRALTRLLPAPAGGAALAGGRFTALNRTRELGDPPDWDCQDSLLWVFHLHYFNYLDPLVPEQRLRLVLDWIERYPPSRHRPGWLPYPLSLRLRNWAKLFFRDLPWPEPARSRVLTSLEAQARCLAEAAEYHLRGNHLLENALTLKFLSACFEGPGVEEWRRVAEDILEAELDEQFLADGGHIERSPMYHALLTGALLDLVNVLDAHDPWRRRLLDRLPAILEFLSAVRHPDRSLALFNDSAFGVATEVEDLLGYAAALGLRVPSHSIVAFPQTGYYVWGRDGDAVLVDAGPVGPDYCPAHAHGDIFSFELSLRGQRVVVDGGTSSYEPGSEREWVRSTRAHNTVEVDGVDQCEFFGAFRMGRRGRPHDVRVELSDTGLHLSGWHDGYRRLHGRPVHRRELRFQPPGVLLVWDRVDAKGEHRVVSRIRLAPGAAVRSCAEGEARLVLAGGRELALRAFGARVVRETGFYAPRFGERVPCEVLSLTTGSNATFGYALSDAALPVEIEAEGARVNRARLGRRSAA